MCTELLDDEDDITAFFFQGLPLLNLFVAVGVLLFSVGRLLFGFVQYSTSCGKKGKTNVCLGGKNIVYALLNIVTLGIFGVCMLLLCCGSSLHH